MITRRSCTSNMGLIPQYLVVSAARTPFVLRRSESRGLSGYATEGGHRYKHQ